MYVHTYIHTRANIHTYIQIWIDRIKRREKVWLRVCIYRDGTYNALCVCVGSVCVRCVVYTYIHTYIFAHTLHINTYIHTLQHTATPCNTLQHPSTPYNTLQHTATPCNALQHPATHYNTLQHTTTQRIPQRHLLYAVHPATPCNALQHPATHYNTPQHTTTQRIPPRQLLNVDLWRRFLLEKTPKIQERQKRRLQCIHTHVLDKHVSIQLSCMNTLFMRAHFQKMYSIYITCTGYRHVWIFGK